jgi:hypothetical protein
VTFRYRQPDIPYELLEFTKEMVNRDDVLEQIRSRSFEPGSHLVRLPLPLSWYVGKLVSTPELKSLETILDRLKGLRQTKGMQDHRDEVNALMAASIFPIELAFKDSLVLAARADDAFSKPLS